MINQRTNRSTKPSTSAKDTGNAEGRRRLKVLEETEDGFKIAEADLKLRGPGELLGHQQSGMPRFRFADFTADLDLIHQARGLAQALVAARPTNS